MPNKKVKFLITNSVPINGGDEALLRATIEGIKKNVPNAEFLVLTNNKKLAQKFLPDISFDYDWEFTNYFKKNKSFLDKKWFKVRLILRSRNIPLGHSFSKIFASRDEKRILKLYKEADHIISSAGGYIHDFYQVRYRIEAYEIAMMYGKKLYFFGQSIGPFFKNDQKEHKQLVNIFSYSKKILLREHLSKSHIEKIGFDGDNITVSTDVAFYLHKVYPELMNADKETKKNIVLCFRKWGDDENVQKIKNKGVEISKLLIDKGYHVKFLSTCQGIEGYIDDSELANEIKNQLPTEYQNKIEIDSKKYSLQDLIKELSKHEAYIGMRLHGAILSMLGGTPAFNLGYEDKTEGIYTHLEMPSYHVSISNNTEEIKSKILKFLEDLPQIYEKIPPTLEKVSNEIEENFKIFK